MTPPVKTMAYKMRLRPRRLSALKEWTVMAHLRLVSSRRSFGQSSGPSPQRSNKSPIALRQQMRIATLEGHLLQLAATRPVVFDVLEQWVLNLIFEDRTASRIDDRH